VLRTLLLSGAVVAILSAHAYGAVSGLIVRSNLALTPTQHLGEVLEQQLGHKYSVLPQATVLEQWSHSREATHSSACRDDRCLLDLLDRLQAERLFDLEILQTGRFQRLKLMEFSRNRRREVTDFCKGCGIRELTRRVQNLAEQLFSRNPYLPVHSAPIIPDPPEMSRDSWLIPALSELPIELQVPELLAVPGFEPGPELPDVPKPTSLGLPPATLIEAGAEDAVEDLLIFSRTADLVQEPQGEFLFQVSAFSPLRSVSFNGKTLVVPKETFEASFAIPYTLEAGENTFEVEAISVLGENVEEFVVFLETDLVKREKPKPPFTMVVLASVASDDNALSVDSGNSKTTGTKSSFILVPGFNFTLDHDSRIAVKSLLVGDRYQETDLRSQEIILKQLSTEWVEKLYVLRSEATLGLGGNTISLRDDNQASTLRDAWAGDYKQYTRDTFGTLSVKTTPSETMTWTTKLEYRLKDNVEDDTADGQANTGSVSLKFPALGWQHTTTVGLVITDLADATADKTETKGSYKLAVPILGVSGTAQINLVRTSYASEDSTGVVPKKVQQTYTLGVSYPIASWFILGYSLKHQRQSSNLVGDDYVKNTHTLQTTFVF